MNFNISSKLVFIDNFPFLSASLDTFSLDQYLNQDFESKALDLVKQIAVNLYGFIIVFEKFNEKLPRKKSFKVCREIKELKRRNKLLKFGKDLKKMSKDYYDLYFYSVLFLVAVFEKFRNSSLKNYCLCPIHYLSAQALNWDAMLDMTKVEFEHISDADIYLFLE